MESRGRGAENTIDIYSLCPFADSAYSFHPSYCPLAFALPTLALPLPPTPPLPLRIAVPLPVNSPPDAPSYGTSAPQFFAIRCFYSTSTYL